MKHKRLTSVLVFTIYFAVLGLFSIGQGMPPPPPPGHGSDGDQPVPVSSGFAVLAVLGLGLGGKKLYDARKQFKLK
jgi:hypothetical protein